jgi:ankyrin repeat protein
MKSRVINPPALKLDKKMKPLNIKAGTDVLQMKNMTKHKSQDVYIQKSKSKDKPINKRLKVDSKKNLKQVSPKNKKNKQALSPRIMSPNISQKVKNPKNTQVKNKENNNKKNILETKHSLGKIMDNDSCQEIESEEDEKSNGRKSINSSDTEIIDEREFDIGSPITDKIQKYHETKFPTLSANPFMMDSSKEQSINKNVKESNNISIDIMENNTNNETDYPLYVKLLNLAKKGDRELFLEALEKILSLPNNSGNINFKDENGLSALHYACDEGNLKIVQILIKTNCNCKIRTNDKKTP